MSNLRNVSRIRAEGVLDEFSYDIRYGGSDDGGRIRVIYAPNGRGKTNFIKAVSYLLTPSLESLQALIEVPIRRLTVEFEGGGSVGIDRQAAFAGSFTATANLPGETNEEHSLVIEPSDFAGRLYRRVWDERQDFNRYVEAATALTTGAALIGDDRLALSVDEMRENIRGDGAYSSPRRRGPGSVGRLLDRVERMLSQSAFAGLARETAAAGVYAQITRTTLAGSKNLTSASARGALESKIADLIRAGAAYEPYGLLSLRQLRDISSQLTDARQNSGQLPTLHRILNPYLDSVQDQVESLAPALQLIDTFVTGVNSFLDRKELRFSTSHGISLVGGSDGVQLQPDVLSSGERHLLYLMSHAILATADRPLLVIDEPELSLGIEWQRNLLPELLRCTASAGVQFLVASHSLQVMNAVPRRDIVLPGEG